MFQWILKFHLNTKARNFTTYNAKAIHNQSAHTSRRIILKKCKVAINNTLWHKAMLSPCMHHHYHVINFLHIKREGCKKLQSDSIKEYIVLRMKYLKQNFLWEQHENRISWGFHNKPIMMHVLTHLKKTTSHHQHTKKTTRMKLSTSYRLYSYPTSSRKSHFLHHCHQRMQEP